MKISIITAVFNGVKTVEDCVKSVLDQTYPDIEHIIIDGGSTDGTLELIKKYTENVAKVMSEPDNGLYDAMNKGIKAATGDIVGILNSDDIYNGNMVLKKVADVFTDPSVDVCYADLVYVDKYDLNKVFRYWKSRDYQDGLFSKGWAPPHPTFFVRRRVYEKYGVFDLEYKLAADFELMVRFLGKYKIPSAYIPNVLVKMRLGGATNRSVLNVVKQNLEIRRAGKKNNISISLFVLTFKKSIDRITQFISRPEKGVS